MFPQSGITWWQIKNWHQGLWHWLQQSFFCVPLTSNLGTNMAPTPQWTSPQSRSKPGSYSSLCFTPDFSSLLVGWPLLSCRSVAVMEFLIWMIKRTSVTSHLQGAGESCASPGHLVRSCAPFISSTWSPSRDFEISRMFHLGRISEYVKAIKAITLLTPELSRGKRQYEFIQPTFIKWLQYGEQCVCM